MASILIPIIKGVISLVAIILILYGVFFLLRMIGIFKLFKWLKKTKRVSDKDFEVVANVMATTDFKGFAEFLSKFDSQTQDRYIQAYLELEKAKKEVEEENGKEK